MPNQRGSQLGRVRGTPTEVEKAARRLRQEQTPAEEVLWRILRNRKLHGLKFRRQHPLGRFILDFCCVEHRLVVELGGSVHDQQTDYDQARTEALVSFGYRVIRFTNDEILNHSEHIVSRIKQVAIQP